MAEFNPLTVCLIMSSNRNKVLESISLKEFQQPINCCNITSLAYAFSVVSEPITVNDVFHMALLPADFVVLDGMTLAETFNAAVEVASKVGGIFVEAYHFDQDLVDFESFKAAIINDTYDTQDQLICNFSVRIAHQWDHGGGHFALVGDCEPTEDGDLILTMCEVHPMKYGKTWTCSAKHMFEAMVDKDGDANRARGLIRVGNTSAPRGIDGLYRAQKSVCYCDPHTDPDVSAWLSRFASLPADKFQMVMNLGGTTAAALAITGLAFRERESICTPDDIMRGLRRDYTVELGSIDPPTEVTEVINRFAQHSDLPIKASEVSLGKNADEMLAILDAAVGPANTTTKNRSTNQDKNNRGDSIALLLFDINLAMGVPLIVVDPSSEAAKLSHFAAHWAIAVSVDTVNRKIVFADPRSKITTRLWEATADELWSALEGIRTETAVIAHQVA